MQHQLQQWAKYWYSIVWDVLTQSINNGGNKLFLTCKSTSSEGSTAKNSQKRDNI